MCYSCGNRPNLYHSTTLMFFPGLTRPKIHLQLISYMISPTSRSLLGTSWSPAHLRASSRLQFARHFIFQYDAKIHQSGDDVVFSNSQVYWHAVQSLHPHGEKGQMSEKWVMKEMAERDMITTLQISQNDVHQRDTDMLELQQKSKQQTWLPDLRESGKWWFLARSPR